MTPARNARLDSPAARPDSFAVYLLTEREGKALVQLRDVTLGPLVGNRVAVKSGLAEKESLVEQMREAIAEPGPVVLDVHVSREENCYPMIPAGQAARDMVG